LICSVSTSVRLIARRPDDPRPIEQHDAHCDQHGIVSSGWPTDAAAQNAADLHAATAAYGHGTQASQR
jgi:hypothetical protein